MAKFRKVHVEFWTDSFLEELSPEDRYFYIFLLTNPYTKQCGVYEITPKKISNLTGYTVEVAKTLLKRFVDYGKIKYNEHTKEVCILNWGKFNLNKGGKPIVDCLESEFKNVKDRTLLLEIVKYVDNQSIKDCFNKFLQKISGEKEEENTIRPRYVHDTSTMSGQEEEKEKEKEEEKEEEAKSLSLEYDFSNPKDVYESMIEYFKSNPSKMTGQRDMFYPTCDRNEMIVVLKDLANDLVENYPDCCDINSVRGNKLIIPRLGKFLKQRSLNDRKTAAAGNGYIYSNKL